jgi:Flp pilus assembly protein TadD
VPHWHDPEQARALFQQAKAAFDREDYWLSIELCQKAVEIDGKEAEYHFLLGRALSQNPKWRYDAAESLRKAAELDPSRADIMATLGEIYVAQGLQARARRTFEAARSIDPNFSIPE